MRYKTGFIGCGKMAEAVIKGILKSGLLKITDIIASVTSEDSVKKVNKKLGIKVLTDNEEVVKSSEIIFLAVKPYLIKQVLDEVKNKLTDEKVIVSIAAGVKTTKIEDLIGKKAVIRVMPNTPMLVGEGMCSVCKGEYATEKQFDYVIELLSKTGKILKTDEDKIDILTAISGCGPAFFYLIIDEIAKAGEKLGLDYKQALISAAQTAFGSAKMIMETGVLPDELIKKVATKGGSTEVGLKFMSENNTAALFEKLIKRVAKKSEELGYDE